MKSKYVAVASLLLTTLLLAGCVVNSGIPGSGVAKTETRDVAGFNSISIAGIGTYEITVGDAEAFEVTADDNLLPILETKLENDGSLLKIRFSENVSPNTPIQVKIGTQQLAKLTVSGACKVNFSNLESEQLELNVSGANTISGNAKLDSLLVTASGATSLKLEEVVAKSVTVKMSGAGSGTVHATEAINANLSGAGSLKVKGNPEQVEKKASGIASVKMIE